MDDPLQIALRMLPILLFALARLPSHGDSLDERTPARPSQLPPRRSIRRNRVEFRSPGVRQAERPAAPSSDPMWDRWLDF
jgi:hypothetical protein